MTVRDPCRFGEVTVTVTPGIGEPSVVTVPVRLAVVCAAAGSAINNKMMANRFQFIVPPASASMQWRFGGNIFFTSRQAPRLKALSGVRVCDLLTASFRRAGFVTRLCESGLELEYARRVGGNRCFLLDGEPLPWRFALRSRDSLRPGAETSELDFR